VQPAIPAAHVDRAGSPGKPELEALQAGIRLSVDILAVGGQATITVTLTNNGKAAVSLNRNAISAWITMTDSRRAPVHEIPFMDEIHAPGKPSPLMLPPGGSGIVRAFGGRVTRGHWKGFGDAGEYRGVALVVQRDYGASCYPLTSVPGEYVLRCHLRLQEPGADASRTVELVSDEVRVRIAK
jgi:hypothetical protein